MADGTWVLVADRSRARIFQEEREGLVEIMAFTQPSARQHTRDLVSDQPGRKRGQGQAGGSSPGADPKEVAALRFAVHLAGILARGASDRLYDDLVLAAPPHFLGLLRKSLNPAIARRVVSAIPHDFTAYPAEEISDRIHSLMWR